MSSPTPWAPKFTQESSLHMKAFKIEIWDTGYPWIIYCVWKKNIKTSPVCITNTCIRPKKIKGLYALLAWKREGSVGWSPPPLLLWMQKKCNIIHMYALLGKQSLRIGLILVLEMVVFQYIWLKYLFGTVLYYDILTFYFNIFVKKYKVEYQKKKKKKKNWPLFPNFLGWGLVGKGQTNTFFLGLMMDISLTYSVNFIKMLWCDWFCPCWRSSEMELWYDSLFMCEVYVWEKMLNLWVYWLFKVHWQINLKFGSRVTKWKAFGSLDH